MWTFVVVLMVLFFLRGRVVRIAKKSGRAPWPYVALFLTFPLIAFIGGWVGGWKLADILNPGDDNLLVFLTYGAAISSFVLAVSFILWLAGRSAERPPGHLP
jgi:heme A synthase